MKRAGTVLAFLLTIPALNSPSPGGFEPLTPRLGEVWFAITLLPRSVI